MTRRAKVHFIAIGAYTVWVIAVLGIHYYFTGTLL